MRLVDQAYLLLIFLTLTATSTLAQTYAKSGCQYMCGDVRIPYPFGIGANCSLSEWYTVDCTSSMPYISTLNNLEVLDINVSNQTVTVNVSMISDFQNPIRNNTQISNLDLGRTPFMFSRVHNKFVAVGCGNAFILDDGIAVSGCSTTFGNYTVIEREKFLGVGCCQTAILDYLTSYRIDITGLERQGGDGGYGSAFLVDENSYAEGRFTGNSSYVSMSLLWTLSGLDIVQNCCYYAEKVTRKVDLGNGTSFESWKCRVAWPVEGNPYLSYGCADMYSFWYIY
ncbi:hypothetical protein Lser_V15G07102 [Lactuca serriola]